MAKPLKVLIVEDSEDDADMVLAELRRAGFDTKWSRVEAEADFLAEIKKQPDIILSDYAMPRFSGLLAAELLHKSGLDIPFILISGTVGEDVAVEAMRHGATDYLLKDRITRLGSAVERAMEQKRLRDEYKKSEEELRTSEERFRVLIENASDLITVVDKECVFRFVSPSAKRMLGYEPPELLNRNAFELIHADDKDKVMSALQRALADSTSSSSVEHRFQHKDGSWRILHSIGRNVPNLSPDGYVVVNSRDITETNNLEEQLRQAQKMEGIGQLAGGVAHDFNNILAVIMMQADVAASCGPMPKMVQDGLQLIQTSSERAASLTRQLLLFSRKQVMQASVLDLNDVVRNISKMLQRLIREDIQLQLHLHSAPLHTHADAGMVDQILLNLAVNARDAMPDGGTVLIETRAKEVDANFVSGWPDVQPGRYVSLTVSDTGTGIPPEVLPRIFEPFFTTKEPGKGTGLGLATVFGIVKQHSGFLTVESEPGKGTKFHVFLPASDIRPESAKEVAKKKPLGRNELILLVEDEEQVRHITRSLLEQHSYQVLDCANGVEALQLWETHGKDVALLLTDLVMPGGVSGHELGRRLRESNPHLKVIYVSGYSPEIAGRQIELKLGENFLQKPFPSNQLLTAIRRSLDD